MTHQARIFICDSTDPAPVYQRLRFDGIRFYRCTFPRGAWQTYRYPQAVRYCELPSCHINVSGTMVEPTGVWPDQGPGWMSREEQFVIPAGVFTRLAATDVVRWCCTGVSNGEPTDFVRTLRLTPGAGFTLEQGENLLIAEGGVWAGGRIHDAGRRLKAVTGPQAVDPVCPGFAFAWRTDEVLRRYPARQ